MFPSMVNLMDKVRWPLIELTSKSRDLRAFTMRNVHRCWGRPCSLALLAALCLVWTPRSARADLDDEIGEATDAGVQFLLRVIDAKQVETGAYNENNMGKISLETYALVVAGVSVEHPTVQKNFDTLAHMSIDHT